MTFPFFVLSYSTLMMCVVFLSFAYVFYKQARHLGEGSSTCFFFFSFFMGMLLCIYMKVFFLRGGFLFGQLDGGRWAGHNKILNIITINDLGWWGIMRTRLNQNELPAR